jgi:vesicle coat complex subunit
MIGAWSPKLTKADRGTVYRTLTDLLADDDVVIQLSAVHSLFQVVDEWDFDLEQFLPYVQTIIDSLAAMLQQVSEIESQQKVWL